MFHLTEAVLHNPSPSALLALLPKYADCVSQGLATGALRETISMRMAEIKVSEGTHYFIVQI
jgi:hypothetical protein